MRLSTLAGNNNHRVGSSDAGGVLGLVRPQVAWRATHIISTLGSVEAFASDADAAVRSYGKDAVKEVSRRKHLHDALDQMMSQRNITEDRAPHLHRALDKLLDEQISPEGEGGNEVQNRVLHEPNEPAAPEGEEIEDDEDAEPEEDNEHPHKKVRIPTHDAFQRSLDEILASVSSGNYRIVATDSGDTLELGKPDDVAADALQQFPISYDINRRAKQPWFSALRHWVGKHPHDTKIKDLHQPTLHKLLHELQTAA